MVQHCANVQKLEQQNDDFERQFRQVSMTLESFERTVDSRLEENAILQQDLEEQQTETQKLKEEVRGMVFVLGSARFVWVWVAILCNLWLDTMWTCQVGDWEDGSDLSLFVV